MKNIFLTLITITFFSCKTTKISNEVAGFKLGKKLSYKAIETKIGDINTLSKVFKTVKDSTLVGVLFEEDTWDYVLPNGKKGFISFYTDSSNNLVRVFMQQGTLKEEFPYPNNPRTLWKIIQSGENSDVEYMRNYLSKKYGPPSDSVASGLFRELIWKLNDFNVELNFYEGASSKISILYYMTPIFMHTATPNSLKNKERLNSQ